MPRAGSTREELQEELALARRRVSELEEALRCSETAEAPSPSTGEAQRAEAERPASMGKLAADVAHAINNPLSYTLYNLESLAEDLPEVLRRARELHASALPSSEGVTASELALHDDILARFRSALEGAHRICEVARDLSALSRGERDSTVTKPSPTPTRVQHVAPPSGRILVVDDEAEVRAVLVRMLHGHETVRAESGATAQRILVEDSAFDLILCDLLMPDLSGMELHQWLAEEHPELAQKVVFITGGAYTPKARAYIEGVDVPCLEKPFEQPEVLEVVESYIQRSKGSGRP